MGPYHKKFLYKNGCPIYKKMSHLLRYSYCLKDIFILHLTILFLILVGVFLFLFWRKWVYFFMRVY